MRWAFPGVGRAAIVAIVLLAGCQSVPTAQRVERMPESLPRGAWRFAITNTTDSTVAFSATDAPWLRTGMRGYAVDPLRRDAFVANLAIIAANRGEFNALVTGQVRPVDSAHVVIVVRPRTKFWRAGHFWTGLFTGVAVATGTALIAK